MRKLLKKVTVRDILYGVLVLGILITGTSGDYVHAALWLLFGIFCGVWGMVYRDRQPLPVQVEIVYIPREKI